MHVDLGKNTGSGSHSLANKQWDQIDWVSNWQKTEEGSFTCHMIAIIEHTTNDNTFYIDESTYQWTIANDLKIWVSTDWEMDLEARFLL